MSTSSSLYSGGSLTSGKSLRRLSWYVPSLICHRFAHQSMYVSIWAWAFSSLPLNAFLASGLSVSGICHYIQEQGERLIGHLVVVVAITVEQFWYELLTPGVTQYDLYHCHMQWIMTLGYVGYLWVILLFHRLMTVRASSAHRPKKIHPCPWMHVWSHWCPDFRYMLVFVVPHPPLTLLPLPPGLHCNLTWNLLFYVHGGSHSDVSWTTIWPAL